MRVLLDRVQFELPESPVAQETRNVVFDIVQENTKRGLTRQAIEQHKEQIYSAAASNAKERVKSSFLMQRIAEKEDIKVSQEEIARRITYLAALYQIPADRFAKDLQKRNGLIEIYDQIMTEKVMEMLQKNAALEDVPPGSLEPVIPNPS
jgi:trigger factor